MDAARKSPQPAPPPPPPAASAAAISAVLGDGDLLREILLRLDFPICLVRTAAISKRWLRHASHPAFLRRFCERRPPRLLGFHCCPGRRGVLHFVPMPQPLEVAAVIRRGRFEVGNDVASVSDCRNGRLVVAKDKSMANFALFSPLHPARGTTALPQLPIPVAVTRGERGSYW